MAWQTPHRHHGAGADAGATAVTVAFGTVDPEGCEDGPEQALRRAIWSALRDDDPVELVAALLAGVGGNEAQIPAHVPALLRRLDRGLWNGGRRWGLLHAAASGIHGEPSAGAVKCLGELLSRYPDAWTEEQVTQVELWSYIVELWSRRAGKARTF